MTLLSNRFNDRKNFLNKKAAMQKLTKAYGPTFLELATKKPKLEVKKIMEEHNAAKKKSVQEA